MTKYQFIKENYEMLKECLRNGINSVDARNADIYEAIMACRDEKNKIEYCIAKACTQYGVSTATCWRIIKSMGETIKD